MPGRTSDTRSPPAGPELQGMSSPARMARVRRRTLGWVLGWIGAAALYLLLIDITDLPELIVGAGVAAVAASGFELARAREGAGQRARLQWASTLHRALLQVPSDVIAVSVMAIRQLIAPRTSVGAFRATSFATGGEAEPVQRGRRALAESMGSFAPNTIVIGVDLERELVLAHQLRRGGGADAIDVLRIGAR